MDKLTEEEQLEDPPSSSSSSSSSSSTDMFELNDTSSSSSSSSQNNDISDDVPPEPKKHKRSNSPKVFFDVVHAPPTTTTTSNKETKKRKRESGAAPIKQEYGESVTKEANVVGCDDTEEEEEVVLEEEEVEEEKSVGRGGLGLGGDERWRAHQMADDYITLAGNIMYPSTYLGPFGYNHTIGQYPIERLTTLGLLTSPLRRPTVIEKWSPYEIAMFESSLSLYGKHFHKVQKIVRTKTTKEIIEFYYVWKKSSHYKRWKSMYEPDIVESESDLEEDRKGGGSEGGGGGEERKKSRKEMLQQRGRR